MKTKTLAFGLTGLLASAAAFAAHAEAGVGGLPGATDLLTAAQVQAMEEIVVYGKRMNARVDEHLLAAALREQMRVVNERLKVEIAAELKELAAPRLQLAGADFPLVVNLPQA